MDPVAHTLVGAVLAETGLRRLSPYATATLLIGANLPDLDVLAKFWGPDASLWFRRGWSHGILAVLLMPLLLTALVWLYHRVRGRWRAQAPPARFGWLLLLACLGVWSHPLLDWLNTYGVRLLMPVDGRWFYGDTLFIVDPWVWLLAAGAVVMARSHRLAAGLGWAVLALACSALVLATSLLPPAAKLLWLAGLALILWLRRRDPGPRSVRLAARASLLVLLIYGCSAYGLARLAEQAALARWPEALEAQANPLPGQPAVQRVVLVFSDHYRVRRADGSEYRLARQEPGPVVQAALESPSIRGFVNWMRYPWWEVEAVSTGWWVRIRDLRYQEPGREGPGIGRAEVLVPREAVPEASESP